jgi:hypothetical protein
MNIQQLRRALAATALAVLAGCGGGGADGGIGGTGGGGDGGIGGTGVSYGTITDFGSVWVNGVEFSSSTATIKIDDNIVPDQRSLRIGMVVRVDGSIPNKTADSIIVDDAIKGRVEQVLDANLMRVMGQLVQIDNQSSNPTRFENGVVPVAGDLVDVHGLVAGDGIVAASFIEKKASPANPPFAVKGTVKNHDTAAQTFQIGTLAVRYAGAIINDMPAGSWTGRQVDVKGTACAGAPVCGTLTASKVEPAGANVATAAQAEIEGIVSAVSGTGFTVGNQAVVTTASTRYEGGLAGDIVLGAKLEVEGSITGGVLTAVKVSFRDAIRLEADVATVSGSTVTLAGLPGVTVSVNSLTEFKGGITSLAGVQAGSHLRIRGRAGTGGAMTATELELRSNSTRVELQAAATAVTGTASVTLLGVVVDTSTISDANFQDLTGTAVGRSAFFAAAKVGTLIKARGVRSGAASVVWDQIELEN